MRYKKGEYVPADTAEGLQKVGGEKWRLKIEEQEMRELFEAIAGREVQDVER
jgi:hypothetical protein